MEKQAHRFALVMDVQQKEMEQEHVDDIPRESGVFR